MATVAVVAGRQVACGDVAEDSVALDTMTLQGDFGAATGTLPAMSCTAADASACADLPAPAGVSGWQVGCDVAAGKCFGQADMRLQQSVVMTSSTSLDTSLRKQAVRYLRSVDIAYTIPTNTLTFALARIQVFVVVPSTASDGQTAASSDVLVGEIDPVAAGEVVTTSRHLVIAEGSPARDAIAGQVGDGHDLALAFVVSPRVMAGAPMPAGSFLVSYQPTLKIAISWSQILP
jgi:hypothetical protein